jgi:type I restriction enzyme S subunit
MAEVRLAELTRPAGKRAGAETDLPVYSVTKHAGFVPSLEYFKKQVFSRNVEGYKLVEPGDFAYATIHLDEGSIGIAPGRALISPMYTVFRIDESRVDRSYLIRFLKSPRVLAHYPQLGKGAVHRRKAISLPALGTLGVPLPHLDEQRRIAAILDHADAIRAMRRRVLAHLDALTQSIFHDILGSLNELRPFAETCARVTVGVVIKPASHYVESGVPALRTLNVKPGRIDMRDLVYFSQESNNGPLAKSRLRAGDLVIARTGKPGTTAIVPEHLHGANAIDLIVATPKTDVADPLYLESLLNSDLGKRIVGVEARGQIQQHFNVGSLKAASVPVPPLSQQREFASKIGQVNAQRATVQRALAADNELFASLQSRAFRGDL